MAPGSDAVARAAKRDAPRSPTKRGRCWQSGCANSAATPTGPLFPSRRGQHLTRGAIWRLVTKHAVAARAHCPSLAAKNITPHTLRHTAAMRLLRARPPVDTATIALWLGHEALASTNKTCTPTWNSSAVRWTALPYSTSSPAATDHLTSSSHSSRGSSSHQEYVARKRSIATVDSTGRSAQHISGVNIGAHMQPTASTRRSRRCCA